MNGTQPLALYWTFNRSGDTSSGLSSSIVSCDNEGAKCRFKVVCSEPPNRTKGLPEMNWADCHLRSTFPLFCVVSTPLLTATRRSNSISRTCHVTGTLRSRRLARVQQPTPPTRRLQVTKPTDPFRRHQIQFRPDLIRVSVKNAPRESGAVGVAT